MTEPSTPSEKALVERFAKAGIDPAQDRWSAGIPHHPKSEELVSQLQDYDWMFMRGYFDWRTGGDGDNGEILMYQLDALFELEDWERKESMKEADNG